ncbi:MAG: hypothetical protein ACI8PZ_004610 [Myxococcota bacterium]|jgi:hypothetical protein
MAAWVIGDIHGCFESLMALEAEILAADPYAKLVSVGDMIDRGPNSNAVVERFCSGPSHVAVMGNHEEFLLRVVAQERPDLMEGIALPRWLDTTDRVLRRKPRRLSMASVDDWRVNARLMWLLQGGSETVESYGGVPSEPETWQFPREHLEFIAALPLVWQDEHQVVTHALVNRADLNRLRGPASVPRDVAGRALWGRVPPEEAPDPARIHVSGHTVRGRVMRHPERRLVQLDTGAYLGGHLTAYSAELEAVLTVGSHVMWEMA